ncbi:hypothetical protein HDU96_002173 [Phlyctochytrium bullatum]|nr:hypothetical protein HDU96_002173 [Phlyctochytrium bullatum]
MSAAAPLETLPVELARKITLHLHPASLSDLLVTSTGIRHKFLPADIEKEFLFALDHLTNHGHPIAQIPFRELPETYVLAQLFRTLNEKGCWNDRVHSKVCIRHALPEINCFGSSLKLKEGPHRNLAWIERIVLKLLSMGIEFKERSQYVLVLNLASLLDSVEIVTLALAEMFPKEMKQKTTPTKSKLVTVAVDTDSASDFTLAWAVGYLAVQAAKDGAINILNYALKHPIYPAAYTVKFRYGDGYMFTDSGVEFGGGLMTPIHVASMGGHVHAIHYLLGNPLPLAPPGQTSPVPPVERSKPRLCDQLEWNETDEKSDSDGSDTDEESMSSDTDENVHTDSDIDENMGSDTYTTENTDSDLDQNNGPDIPDMDENNDSDVDDSDDSNWTDTDSDENDAKKKQPTNIHRTGKNPLAKLSDYDMMGDLPLGFLLRDFPGDPLPAAHYLLSQGAKLVPPHFAVVNGNADALRLMLDHGAGVNVRAEAPTRDDRLGMCKGECTPLMYAVYKNDVACVKVLLEYGAKPNKRDRYGDTPLKFAQEKKKVEVAKVLIEAGAHAGTGEKPKAKSKAKRNNDRLLSEK